MPGPLVLLAPPLLGAAGRVLVQGATRAAARTAANKTARGHVDQTHGRGQAVFVIHLGKCDASVERWLQPWRTGGICK